MLNIILKDCRAVRDNLLPLTFTRPVADIRVGIRTIREKWESMLPGVYSYATEEYLANKFPCINNPQGDSIIISAHFLPTPNIIRCINSLAVGEALAYNGEVIAARGTLSTEYTRLIEVDEIPVAIRNLYDIFLNNAIAIDFDFNLMTKGRDSAALSPSNTVIGDPRKIFVEDDATVEGAIINTTHGPVYIGRGAEIMEGSCIRGPFALCEGAEVKMGAKIYGATTIGPHCKVGGEIANAVFIGYSNKAHDGFIGNAVIGEWCNLAAGCVVSNLKNDYSEVKLWNYPARRFLRTGLQFCGLFMGDHSKTGINTMINTATVVGVGVNLHGAGYPRNFVPSFMEGSSAGLYEVPVSKFIDTARKVMARRNIALSQVDIEIFETLYRITDDFK
ncbi:MAG: glucose-1-phosphate thymidylyltransferase [Muribaculaceae bacterium]|nr:glucose-1-phosphate thymidylyltransferase [Muribaculaceae bacterium]